MSIKNNILLFQRELGAHGCRLVAVTKTHPPEMIMEAYDAGQRIFGENKAQEMTQKWEALPKDIEWHMIGHLQTNKVKYIAPYVSMIHAVDSLKLAEEINKQAARHARVIRCLLQLHIAEEESKFGLNQDELEALLKEAVNLPHIRIKGLMGMATLTSDEKQVEHEFNTIETLFKSLQKESHSQYEMTELSIGMSGDYKIALRHGSTLARIGSAIFGSR